MNQQEWLKWRKGGIGGSDAAVVMKLFPFEKTPLKLYREKISGEVSQEENKALTHGRENEERALQWFEKKMNRTLFRQVRVEMEDCPWLRSTLDGIDGFDEIMVEVKCPFNLKNHEQVKISKKVPEIYYPQCQHQLLVKKMDGMYFESFNSQDPEDSVILEVTRDDQYIAEMLSEHGKFWDCVQNRIPPAATEYDFLWRQDQIQWQEAVAKFNEAKAWEETAAYWRQKLIDLSEGRNSEGCGIRVTHSECKGHIDYEQIPELKGVNKELYRKPSYFKSMVKPIKKS